MKKLLLALPLIAIFGCDAQAQKSDKEINEMIKTFILENPEVLLESVENYQKEKMQKAMEEMNQSLAALLPEIESTGPFIGNENAENTIIEFFDYNCGFCKRSVTNIEKLKDSGKDVKIIFKELPILSPKSELVAKAALAVHYKQPEKYYDFHVALMKNKERPTLGLIKDIAAKLGITKVNFDMDIDDQKVKQEIEKNKEIAEKVGISGTPAFIVNGKLIPGAVPYEELVSNIK